MKSSFELYLSSHFLKQVQKRELSERQKISHHLIEIQTHFGAPHQHLGTGIRKLSKHIFESRLDLATRLIFEKKDKILFFHTIGNHDDVKKFLKNHI